MLHFKFKTQIAYNIPPVIYWNAQNGWLCTIEHLYTLMENISLSRLLSNPVLSLFLLSPVRCDFKRTIRCHCLNGLDVEHTMSSMFYVTMFNVDTSMSLVKVGLYYIYIAKAIHLTASFFLNCGLLVQEQHTYKVEWTDLITFIGMLLNHTLTE